LAAATVFAQSACQASALAYADGTIAVVAKTAAASRRTNQTITGRLFTPLPSNDLISCPLLPVSLVTLRTERPSRLNSACCLSPQL
jgi:hypothetical protein